MYRFAKPVKPACARGQKCGQVSDVPVARTGGRSGRQITNSYAGLAMYRIVQI